MTLYESLTERLSQHAQVLGFDPVTVEQRSYQWFRMRLGVITASGVSAVLAKPGSATRDGYMAELIAEIATGAPGEPVSAKAMQWGIEQEPAAIETYSFNTGHAVRQIPFIYGKGMRFGCSPDGVMGEKTLEIKCPFNTRYHIELIVDGRMKKEYQEQVQFQMYVAGTNEVDFLSFDPRMQKHMDFMVTVERSDKYMQLFDDAIPQFIMEMDMKLEKLGFSFGEQWK